MKIKRWLWVFWTCWAVSTASAEDAKIIRVGIFDLEPLNFMDQEGVAQGFNVDLLRKISVERNRWQLEFVPVTWAEGLEKLQTEELDLMVSVSFTEQRAEVMDYGSVSVVDVWSQVYVTPGAEVESLLDLDMALVGIMKRGIHGRNFINLADAFGIDVETREFDSHRDIFEALALGEIDAGVAPNVYGLRHARKFNVVGTAIQFSPAPIYFAAKQGRHADVLTDIDAVLKVWKADRNSLYYRCVDYWFGSDHGPGVPIPVWLKLVFSVAVVSAVIFLLLSWRFRREVKIRTAQLQESKERLQEAHRIARLGRWDMDFSTGQVEWSEGMYEILELDPEVDAGSYKDIMKFVFPEDRDLLDRTFKRAIENHARYELQHRVKLLNGKVKWVHESGECEYDESGNSLRAYGTTQDISDQVEATQAYQKSSERLRLATKAGHVGIWEYDFIADHLIWDDQMFEMYGADPHTFEETFRAWTRMVHPDDLNHAEEEFQRAVKEQIAFEADFRIVTHKLQVKHIRALAEVQYDLDGEPLRAVGMNWDVTHYHQMVTALTTSEQDYRQLFENMTTGFMLLQVLESRPGVIDDFKVVQVNEAFAQMAGDDRHAIIGKNLKNILHPLEDEWVDVLSDVSMTGRAASYEATMSSLNLIVSAWVFVQKPGFIGMVLSDDTARKTAEDAVRHTQLQLQHIFDNTSDVIFKVNPEGTYTYLNPAAEEMTGYPIDELLGKSMFDVVVPEQRKVMAERLKDRLARPEDHGSFYFEMYHRDGQKIILEIVPTTVFDDEGRVTAIHGIARDVTERIKAERELEESRRFLRHIIDTIPARVFWKDRESVYLGCNSAFARDAGLESPDKLVGLTDYDLSWAETEAELYRVDDREVMEEGIERLNYEEHQTQEGGQLWLSTSKVPIRDAAGEVIGVLGAYQDITSRKELEEERARLTTAISQSAEAIVVMDLQGFIQYVNPAFETVTGYRTDEAVGQNLSIIKSGKHEAQFYADIWQTIEAGESWDGRIINRHKKGTLYTVESAISPVRNPDGTIENYVVAIRDVSQQVELEEHVRQAQKMDAVGRLAGGVAHDFNNILQSILGFSGILMAELDQGTSQYEDVEEIRNAARRAGDLTRQLLTLSRKHNVEYAVQDLNTILRSSEKMMRRLIGEHISIHFDLEENLEPVRADLSQIEQIILNLFINARDAMSEGGHLTVKTFNVDQANETADPSRRLVQHVCLEVSDTGCGIREDVKQHLFEPFFTTKQVGEGTGLGLSVVYGIVQQHGGHIEVSSNLGQGAVFSIYLPASIGEVASLEEPVVDEIQSMEGNGEPVLVVEDDTVLRELTRRMLRDAGYEVLVVPSYSEAIEQSHDRVFDLIMADMVLPDGNGMELAAKLLEARPDMRVLLVSGYSHSSDVHAQIGQQSFRYLEKPIGSMQLLRTVREMLDEKGSV